MSWKPPRRTLQNVHKIKLSFGHPQPEIVDDLNPEGSIVSRQESIQKHRNDTFLVSENYPTDNSSVVERSYFDKFEDIPEFDHGDDGELDRILFSDFGDSGSTWDDSSASFLSWADEAEDAEAAKTKELFEEVERVIYGEESSVKNDQLLSECLAWTESHISLRVVGKTPEFGSENPSYSSLLEDSGCEEEVFASNSYVERPAQSRNSLVRCGDCSSPPARAATGGLLEKVKKAAMDQLALFALQEAVKLFHREEESELAEPPPQNNSSSGKDSLTSCSTDVSAHPSRSLIVSGKSLRRSPPVLGAGSGRNHRFPCGSEFADIFAQPRRFSSIINMIPEDRSTNGSSSVLGIPRPLNADLPNSSAKPLESTNFLSSAGRRKASLWNRRFSCFASEHERLVKPISSQSDFVRNSSGSLRTNASVKQMSVPSTPLKFLKHLSLPPIDSLNSGNKLSNMQANNQQSLTHIRRIFVKNKVSLSPLPISMSATENNVSGLQLAKSLMESTPDASRWSSCRKVGISGIRNMGTRKKSSDENVNEM